MFFNNIKNITCNNCGENVKENYFKCPNCGTQLICELDKEWADFGRVKVNIEHEKLKVWDNYYRVLCDLKIPKLFQRNEYNILDYIYGSFKSTWDNYRAVHRPDFLKFDLSEEELIELYKEVNNLIYDFLHKGEMCLGKKEFNKYKVSYLCELTDFLSDINDNMQLKSVPEKRIEPISRDKAEKLGLYEKASKPCNKCNI